MLGDKQVLPIIFHWASILQCKEATFDELVNEAYIVSKKLKTPLLLQKWVKWTMVHFITLQRKNLILSNTGQNLLHGTEDREGIIADKSFDFKEFKEFQDDLLKIVEDTCSKEEQSLLHKLFWLGMTYRQIAKVEHVGFQAIFFRTQKILRKLRKAYERKTA